MTQLAGAVSARRVVGLDAPEAIDRYWVGGKAAALARARRRGLPVLPGVVLTASTGARDPGPQVLDQLTAAVARWRRPVVVRSSARVEDGAGSSYAGVFASVTGVDLGALPDAVREVLASAAAVGTESMAVLVQPQLTVSVGGVAFTADFDGAGDERWLRVAAVTGALGSLVGGTASGVEFRMSPHGRLAEPAEGMLLSRWRRWRLARLALRAEAVAGCPQDLEWAYDERGRLWLLQQRPITTPAARARPVTPVLGAGPLAETLPGPLAPLERDLWVAPLADAATAALDLVGARPRADRPPVRVVAGHAVADLEAFGVHRRPPRPLERLDPRRSARRVAQGWRVGRLRAAFCDLARDVVGGVDGLLADVPAPAELSDDELVALLRGCRRALVAVHGHEMLAGLVLPGLDTRAASAAGVALRTLHRERAAGRTDAEVLAAHPVVLSLLPPSIAGAGTRPLPDPGDPPPPVASPSPAALVREALRLRAHWLQELSALAARELGRRLAARGALADPADVARVTLDALVACVAGGPPPVLVPRDGDGREPPPRFRLAADGTVLPVPTPLGAGARGAGGGVGRGVVRHAGAGRPEPGTVLVAPALTPDLAPHLAGLAGLVAETGSALSHLAILAREAGVPTVVGLAGARETLRPGAVVTVDGGAGTVTVHDSSGERR